MAIKYFFRAGQFQQSIHHMYTVDYGVGYRQENKMDDVMLVQFFLRELSKLGISPLGPPLSIDGIFGPMTHYWMLFFLVKAIDWDLGKYLYRGRMVMDGAAWVPQMDQIASFSDAGLIGYLNEMFRQSFKGRWEHLETDAAVPIVLRKALIHRYTSDVQARIIKGEM